MCYHLARMKTHTKTGNQNGAARAVKTNLIYATSFPGKIVEIGRHLGHHGLTVSKLSDFSRVRIDPSEDGETLGQNARIKAHAYARVMSDTMSARGQRHIVIADDTGVFIDGLNGAPGIKVRRWKGYPMPDEEIIEHALESLKGKKGHERNAEFRTAVYMVRVDEFGAVTDEVALYGKLSGHILEKASEERILGFPFESIFFAAEYGMLLGDLHRMPADAKHSGKRYNHRERALEKAIVFIKEWMAAP